MKLAWVVGGFIALSGVAFGIARLEPGAPSVAREQLYLDEVKEGVLERKVRGPGVLQPREARWLATRVEARVDRVLVRPGEAVGPDTIIVELSNPEVERAADAAELEVAASRAEYAAARLELVSQKLDRRSSLAEAVANAESARLQAVAEERAFKTGAVSELQYSRSKILATQLGERAAIEEQRLAALDAAVSAQLDARTARLRQLERTLEERRLAADSLRCVPASRASCRACRCRKASSWCQERMSRGWQSRTGLYAELRIPELMPATSRRADRLSIDMRDRLVRGRVVRVDPVGRRGRGARRDRFRRGAAFAGTRRSLGGRNDRDRDAEQRALYRPSGRRAV